MDIRPVRLRHLWRLRRSLVLLVEIEVVRICTGERVVTTRLLLVLLVWLLTLSLLRTRSCRWGLPRVLCR